MSPRTRRSTWSGTSITVRSTINRLVGGRTVPRRGPRPPVRRPSMLPAPFTITVSGPTLKERILAFTRQHHALLRIVPLACFIARERSWVRCATPKDLQAFSLASVCRISEAELRTITAGFHFLSHETAVFQITRHKSRVYRSSIQGDTPAY